MHPLSPLRRMAVVLLPFEPWFVAASVAVSVLDVRFLLPACLLAAAFWPVRRITTGEWTRRTPADLSVLVVLASVCVSVVVSAEPGVSLLQALRLLSGIGLFYAIVNWADTPSRLRLSAMILICVGAALAAAAPFTVDWSETRLAVIQTWIGDRLPVPTLDLIHPNVLGGALALFMPIAGAVFLFGGSGRNMARIGAFAAFAWMALVLVLSDSRGAIAGVAAALLVLAALRWRWGWLGFLFAGLGLLFMANSMGVESFTDLLFGSQALGGFQGRAEIWARGIFMVQDFPFTGVGFGSFPLAAERLYPFTAAGAQTVMHVHNLFLQVAVDLGLPGLIGWLAVFLTVCRAGWAAARSGGPLAGLGAAVLAVQAALAIHGLFDAVVWGQVRTAPLVWAVWGFALAAGNLRSVSSHER